MALRKVLRSCMRHGLMSAEDYIRASDVEPVRGYREPVGRAITHEDITKLQRTCLEDHSPAGVRDAAIIALMHSTGLRRSEVVGARRSAYGAAARTLQIVGKRNKQRTVYVNARAASWINAWLIHVAAGNGPLFCLVYWSESLLRLVAGPPLTLTAFALVLIDPPWASDVWPLRPHAKRLPDANFLASGKDLVLA